MYKNNKLNNFFTTSNITFIAVLSAISFVLYYLHFSLPIFPSFLEINFSEVAILIGGFMLGLPGGISIIVVRFLLKLPFTTTNAVGEVCDLILGFALLVPTVLIYNKKRNIKFAIFGVLLGVLSTIVVALIINRLFLIDFYVSLYVGGDWDAFLGWFYALYPSITKQTFYRFYLWLAVLPFNAVKFSLCALITVLIYNPLKNIITFVQTKNKGGFEKHEKCILDSLDTETLDKNTENIKDDVIVTSNSLENIDDSNITTNEVDINSKEDFCE